MHYYLAGAGGTCSNLESDMKQRWHDFWYCNDGRFNRASLVQFPLLVLISPLFIVALGPSLVAAWLVGKFIGDEYCRSDRWYEADDKENAQIAVGAVVFFVYAILLLSFIGSPQ